MGSLYIPLGVLTALQPYTGASKQLQTSYASMLKSQALLRGIVGPLEFSYSEPAANGHTRLFFTGKGCDGSSRSVAVCVKGSPAPQREASINETEALYGFIRRSLSATGIGPSITEMADFLGCGRHKTHYLLTRLIESGKVRRLPRKARALEVIA